jgi:DNA polymerase-3 subunit epsilon
MNLRLNKPIIFFDIEATGLNISTDRIVELSYIMIDVDGSEEEKTMRFNPCIPISEEASRVNGITNEDVADCPKFKEKAHDLAKLFERCDLAGFNSNLFDVPLLVEEFIRAGVDFDISKCRFVDVQNIYHKMERRTLSAAYKFYCQKDLENAHTAAADTRATYEVLKAQLDMYSDDLKNDVGFLADFSKRNNNVDLAGRIVYNEQGVEVINFGKYKGKPVADVFRRDPGYFAWVMQGDFTQNTKQAFMRIRLREGI